MHIATFTPSAFLERAEEDQTQRPRPLRPLEALLLPQLVALDHPVG